MSDSCTCGYLTQYLTQSEKECVKYIELIIYIAKCGLSCEDFKETHSDLQNFVGISCTVFLFSHIG